MRTTLTMIHANRAYFDGGVLRVDRKFHTGMQEYCRRLDVPILSVHPEFDTAQASSVMDPVAIPEAELGYRVLTLRCSKANKPLPEDSERLRAAVAQSRLVYGCAFGSRGICVKSGVPYIAALEYNLRTNVVFATTTAQGVVRRAWRAATAAYYHVTEVVPAMRGAAMVHCNGYPSYEEAALFNKNRLLYLDSRMRESMLISEASLRERLVARRGRAPQIVFSGRLEPAKGALDVIKVVADPVLRDVAWELDVYGQGSQRAAVEQLVAERGLGDRVRIHAPVTYPELVAIASTRDVFMCCHVQDDPSCTYVESMGCGLPVVGYANAMWRAMQATSRAGVVTKLGSPSETAAALRLLLSKPDELDALSVQARTFAAAHTFEHEFSRRTDSINEVLRAMAR